LLALAVTLLIVVVLLKVGAMVPRLHEVVPQLITFRLPPEPPARVRTVVKVDRTSHGSAPSHPARVPPLNMTIISRKDFAASDIATLPSHQASGAQAADAGTDSGSADGPGGERLYDVDWYTKPTHAEMAPYLPAGGPVVGWAEIACRMVEKYHVEDCHELGESPTGSGLSRALRQAAWQFRVRPPRIGGRSIIGGWVRIRFDFTAAATADN
jgi:protein TonB